MKSNYNNKIQHSLLLRANRFEQTSLFEEDSKAQHHVIAATSTVSKATIHRGHERSVITCRETEYVLKRRSFLLLLAGISSILPPLTTANRDRIQRLQRAMNIIRSNFTTPFYDTNGEN